MNYRRILGCLAFCVFFIITANAQYSSDIYQEQKSKTYLLKGLPQKSQCNIPALDKLFTKSGFVSCFIAKSFFLRGEVIENIQRNPSVQSINIGLSDYPGAILCLSRIRLEDGSIRYNGHITTLNNSDAMILSLENGRYFFNKIEQRLLITD